MLRIDITLKVGGGIELYAVVDDIAVPHPSWQECRIDNNVGTSTGKCVVPN